jgi:hypothetical protein
MSLAILLEVVIYQYAGRVSIHIQPVIDGFVEVDKRNDPS